ncbi:MAG: nuclease-related domain-containing protein [Proteobacteria bacterium]|nr:nuclease-related domain-containing protein [Pseudomonadota bacterium]
MTYQGNKPGQSARKIKDLIYKKRVHVVLAGILGVLVCVIFLPAIASAGAGGLIVIVVIMKIIMNNVDTKERLYRRKERKAERGARAEETIDNVLHELKGEYALFHDVGTGYGDIDHIVLSREYGLFIIETKSHYGEVTVSNGTLLIDGKIPEKDFITQTLRNTIWLKQRVKEITGLDPWIQPIIVFTRAFVREWEPIRGILLRNQKYLVKSIEKMNTNKAIATSLWALHARGTLLW